MIVLCTIQISDAHHKYSDANPSKGSRSINTQTRIQRSDSRLKKELVFGNGCFLLAGSRSWKNISDVAGMAGFEPTISESKSGVLPLHYIPISGQKSSGIGITPNPRFRGVGKGVRTLDTRNHNPVLSRLSYTHHRSEMVRQEGFEPPAYCLEGSCSIQLSYWRVSVKLERVTGIEPASPAWKAGALAIVLHPRTPSAQIVSSIILAHLPGICQE